MIFSSSRILGFGKFRDLALNFSSGINVVFAPNEGGKSTLQHFLVGLLYGQIRSDLKLQRRLDAWVERYQPWYGQEYGGTLCCRLANGREMEIRRFFGKDENRVEIRTSTGEDITRQYEQQRNGEVLFAKNHLGMPKELYESLGIIRENRASDIHSRDTIRDRLANLAHSGDEDLSVRQSLARLRRILDSIGSERATTRPYRQALDLVRGLQSERKAFEEQRVRFEDWLQKKNVLASDLTGLESELLKVQGLLLSARRQDIDARIRSLEGIEREIHSLHRDIDALGAKDDFPLEKLEELDRLVGARDSIDKRLNAVRTEKEKSLSRLADAVSERQKMEPYASLAGGEESEKITEWFVSYMSLSLQKESLKKTIKRLGDEIVDLEKRLEKTGPVLRDPERDWDSFAREAAEDERIASKKCSEMAKEAVQEKLKLAESVRTAFNRRLAGVLFIALAAAPVAIRYLELFDGLPEWIEYGFGGVFLALSAWMWFDGARIAANGRRSLVKANALELQQAETRENGGVKRKKLDAAIANSEFRDLDAFLRAAGQGERDRVKLADLLARLEETETQQRQYYAESDKVFRHLSYSLSKAGLTCSPGNLKSQVDLLRNNLRRFRELDENHNRSRQNVDSLEAEEASLGKEYNLKISRIGQLLESTGVDTPEQFREECSKRRKLGELIEKEASRTREFKRLSEGRTLAQWKESRLELEKLEISRETAADASVKDSEEDIDSEAPLLPYLPSISELEEKERSLMSELSDTRQEQAHISERILHAFQNYRASSEIDEDLSVAEEKLRELERNREAVGIALDTIETLSRLQQEVLAPQLNAAVERRFIRLCSGRYKEVKIDPDFCVRLRESESGELRSAELLSRGTQDQLYFAIRFGVLDLVTDGNDPCPCLLDEPFAAYDRPRLREAYNILLEESGLRQLILFTCREDLIDISRSRNANIIDLPS